MARWQGMPRQREVPLHRVKGRDRSGKLAGASRQPF